MRYSIVFLSLAAAAAAQPQGVAQGSGSSAYVRMELRMIPLETVVKLCLSFFQLRLSECR
jgi:hypothetical protein